MKVQCPHCLKTITPRMTRIDNLLCCPACEGTFQAFPSETPPTRRLVEPVKNLLRKPPRRTQGPL